MQFISSRSFYSTNFQHSSKVFIDTVKKLKLYQSSSHDLDQIGHNIRGVYMGIDPSAPSLHLGHLPALLTLSRASQSGIPSYLVLGGGTSLIGDPSFSVSSRPALAKETATLNLSLIQEFLSRLFLKLSPISILDNSSWLSKLNIIEFLTDIGRFISIHQLLTRESVASRLKSKHDSFTFKEFSYSLLQAYDFYYLLNNKGINLQIGGNDQYGNMIAGIELITKKNSLMKNVCDPYIITLPLITTNKGQKISKTVGNAVWLSGALLSAFDIFQFFIKCSDFNIPSYIHYFTTLPEGETKEILLHHQNEPQLYIAHKEIAKWVISLLLSEHEYYKALTVSNHLFGGNKEFDADILYDSLSLDSKRFFTASRSDLATFNDLIELILKKNAESLCNV